MQSLIAPRLGLLWHLDALGAIAWHIYEMRGEKPMLRGLFTVCAVMCGGLALVAVASFTLLPIIGLVTALVFGLIKLAFLLALIYFIVKLISPETADRALDKIRSKINAA